MLSPRVRAARASWAAAYLALAIAPLVVARLAAPEGLAPDPPAELGLAFGFLALTLGILQFGLVSRVGTTSRQVGSDRLLALHRGVALLVAAFVAAHVRLLVPDGAWRALLTGGPPAWRFGVIATWVLAVVIATSIFRKSLRLSYEAWQVVHLAGALVFTTGGLAHVALVSRYAALPAVRVLLAGYALLLAGLLARYRVVRPWRLAARPWRVEENADAGGDTRRLRLRPVGHPGLRFEVGQFAWLLTGRSPFWSAQHPLSIASAPAKDGSIEFLIKALGDWSGDTVPRLAPGAPAWVDGPFGGFVPSPERDTRLVLIAGGIGLAPMRGILAAMRGGSTPRPVTLIVAASAPDRVAVRDELADLARDPHVTVVPVYERPPEGWTGEAGFVTADVIRRHAGDAPARAEYLICGPIPMIDAVTDALRSLGVPARRINTERFQMV